MPALFSAVLVVALVVEREVFSGRAAVVAVRPFFALPLLLALALPAAAPTFFTAFFFEAGIRWSALALRLLAGLPDRTAGRAGAAFFAGFRELDPRALLGAEVRFLAMLSGNG